MSCLILFDAHHTHSPCIFKSDTPGWIRHLLSALGAGSSASDLLRASVLVLIVVVSASSVLSLLRSYLYGVAGERLVLRLRRQLFERIMSMEVCKKTITFHVSCRLASCFQRLSSCEPFGPLVLTNSDWVL
jgi:ABC-type multidrug transport system fused ATPase/permease subunit